MARIDPTVGRVVLFWPRRNDNIAKIPGQPLAAIICAVPEGKPTINLVVFSAHGHTHGYENVTLIQDGEPRPPDGDFAEWMLFQKGQAAATEAATALLQAQHSAP